MPSDALKLALERLSVELHRADFAREKVQGDGAATACRKRLSSLVAREPELREAIDDTLREWASGKPLALMDAEAAALVLERMCAAQSFGNWLYDAGFSAPRMTKAHVLEKLLVDYWWAVGIGKLNARLLEMPPS
jgi:hypothetical protein